MNLVTRKSTQVDCDRFLELTFFCHIYRIKLKLRNITTSELTSSKSYFVIIAIAGLLQMLDWRKFLVFLVEL
ncbi:hypothetical protein [Chlorogloeopsis fritschii]|uniref:hypothetical protein n=1 Tax=Chlorogloeopsis fritschii TaxID=1124 RepID=UPI00138AF70D|nr:hypothetical protein [Chlorogloeopsis fritschii]